jgi:hypothetical protein
LEDNVVNIPTQIGMVSFKSGVITDEKNAVVLKTQYGNIVVTPGTIQEGDSVLVLPTQVGNVVLKEESDINCPYLGGVSPRSNEFSIRKTVKRNPDEPSLRWVSQTPYARTYNPSWNIWGNLSIKIDDEEIYSIEGADGEEYSLWDYSFDISDEGTLIELIFTGSYCGMLGAETKIGNVYACLVTI